MGGRGGGGGSGLLGLLTDGPGVKAHRCHSMDVAAGVAAHRVASRHTERRRGTPSGVAAHRVACSTSKGCRASRRVSRGAGRPRTRTGPTRSWPPTPPVTPPRDTPRHPADNPRDPPCDTSVIAAPPPNRPNACMRTLARRRLQCHPAHNRKERTHTPVPCCRPFAEMGEGVGEERGQERKERNVWGE